MKETCNLKTDYLSTKRTLSQVLDYDIYGNKFEEYKRLKPSKRSLLKELKLVHYFENLLISKDNIDDIQMESSRQMFPYIYTVNNQQAIEDDIKIENKSNYFYNNENCLKSALEYERVYTITNYR